MSELTAIQKEKLMTDVRTFISDAEEMMRVTAGEAGEAVTDARKRIEAQLQQARTELVNLQNMVVAKGNAAGKAADEYVRENPWKSIGIAAGVAGGVALVIGLLAGRR
jgi:ElaB/YqjD/DUF883 family membrane-anchored ribosome-binding protein